ncbi:MAG TPA: hypothetical protein PK997_00430 [Candidatus Omnitrophota bacterium]|jgi:hypothetical protein|nr:hypothetical protein [Candidatus Omnitrophota bacterium]HQB93656.1 hypothetical protein [Candidatus Omnitrophota bacterium]
MKNLNASRIFNMVIGGLIAVAVIAGVYGVHRWIGKERMLRQMIERLSADTRVADVLVTKSEFDESTKKIRTTIKFLEYDAKDRPLAPKYFTFPGNIIQFQSLVVRFQDKFVGAGDRLRGKSAYLFMKAFVLDGAKTREFDITKAGEIPAGYHVESGKNQGEFQERLWRDFWTYALDPAKRDRAGIKNAQIEAPGSMFLPGTIYTLRIEHDGGIRIDAQPVPEILKGEKVASGTLTPDDGIRKVDG